MLRFILVGFLAINTIFLPRVGSTSPTFCINSFSNSSLTKEILAQFRVLRKLDGRFPRYEIPLVQFPKQGEITQITIHRGRPLPYGLLPEEVTAISWYTGAIYVQLNQGLWEDHLNHAFQIYYQVLLSALHKIPNYSGVVFRQSAQLPIKLKDMKVGAEFVFKSFMSTSQNQQFVKERHLYIIKTKTGKPISAVSRIAFENEILILPNTKFRIKAYREIETQFYEVELEEL